MKAAYAIALGFFDGVHIAHQKIIKSAIDYSIKNKLVPIALTFDKSPLEILSPGKVSYITNSAEKEKLIGALGAGTHFLPLCQALLDMSGEDFVKSILVEKYNIKYAVCGYNYRFGKGGSGTTQLLRTLGEKYGFHVHVHDKVTHNGEDVSSSRIRELILNGNVNEASLLLGRRFHLSGTVSEGKHLGARLGFPTANVFFDAQSAQLRRGVYKTSVTVDELKLPAITNIGINPTVGGEQLRSETYIPGFHAELYGKSIDIEFVDFIRDEVRFESLDKLKAQIQKDLAKIQKG